MCVLSEKKNSGVGVVSEEKKRRERSQVFHFNSSEVKEDSHVVISEKQRSERSQIFLFQSSEVIQRREGSQIFHFIVVRWYQASNYL